MHLAVEPHRSLKTIASDLQRQSEFCASQKTEYRADIDGLRAIAVLAVLGYHYFGPLFPGGYVGVDIFFVISGYLLSGIIISEMDQGRFSFARFYERRIRRIFPALFALLAIYTLFAEIFLVTPDLRSYLHSMLASSWSASNFYFWKTSNYFDSPAADKPLLHTWSLGVEEQFYILFPILVFGVSRYCRRYLKLAIIVVAAGSFLLSVVQVRSDQTAAFYLPFGRFWELLLGTIIFLRIFPELRNRALREVLALFSLLLIGFAVFGFTLNTRFPGEAALIPCLGAAGLIFVGQTNPTVINRLLTWRPAVFVGLVSYSLYLWHWPLLVFSNTAILPGLRLSLIGGRLLLTALALAMAIISWRFVETPFRAGSRRPQRRTVYLFAMACIALMSISFQFGSSWASSLRQFPIGANAVGSYIDYPSRDVLGFNAMFASGSCFLDRGAPISGFREDLCLSGQNGKTGVLIFGDSEAANLRYGLQQSFPEIRFLQATSSACPPLLHTVIPRTNECSEFVTRVFTDLIPKYRIKTILLSASWVPPDESNLAETIQHLQQRGTRIVLFGSLPEYQVALPRLLAESVAGGTDYARESRRTGLDDFDRILALQARQSWKVPYVSLSEILCPDQVCVEYAGDGVPIQFDHVHLTLPGSVLVGQRVARTFPNLFKVP